MPSGLTDVPSLVAAAGTGLAPLPCARLPAGKRADSRTALRCCARHLPRCCSDKRHAHLGNTNAVSGESGVLLRTPACWAKFCHQKVAGSSLWNVCVRVWEHADRFHPLCLTWHCLSSLLAALFRDIFLRDSQDCVFNRETCCFL